MSFQSYHTFAKWPLYLLRPPYCLLTYFIEKLKLLCNDFLILRFHFVYDFRIPVEAILSMKKLLENLYDPLAMTRKPALEDV
jgi:hypothetical protein